jgi:hypothetical protein
LDRGVGVLGLFEHGLFDGQRFRAQNAAKDA